MSFIDRLALYADVIFEALRDPQIVLKVAKDQGPDFKDRLMAGCVDWPIHSRGSACGRLPVIVEQTTQNAKACGPRVVS
ncbi:MAG TPA: hypothetical protein VGF56_09510 [Rhizomicrobium sp.]|jgi:hypothetical protein